MTSPSKRGYGSYVVSSLRARFLRLSSALVILWLFALWWGEHVVYQRSARGCLWQNWEQWPAQSNPHHVLFIADPQLVDPHTYPGRPWPLSSLTIFYTDLYLRRASSALQGLLQPDSTIFLGDLFDGGREWATAQSSSPERRYKKYGTKFWLREYKRFLNIFLKTWQDGNGLQTAWTGPRRIIASLPGNHDLGFASGIEPAVKSRFDAYFGPLNRIDVIGNHSFVTLDTVSLSAMDQIDPVTGSSGAGDGSASATASSNIWKPVENFLVNAKSMRARAVQREYRHLDSLSQRTKPKLDQPLFSPEPRSIFETVPAQQESGMRTTSVGSSNFPTIVLSHVPFFRSDSSDCGPFRERGTSIPLSAGYQYQNVLTPLISRDIVTHLGADEVVMIYSGDDHDYCEIEHSEFTGQMREITVKSMSWAMGIRRPGVQLASLWNPIDLDEARNNPDPSTPRKTVQNKLCLLPDQLGIFMRYGQLLALTVLILAIQAIRHDSHASTPSGEPLLPVAHRKPSSSSAASSQTSSVSTSPADTHANGLSTRTVVRPASPSPSKRVLAGYGNIPTSSRSASPAKQHLPSRQDHHDHDPFLPSNPSHAANSARSRRDDDDDDDWGMPRIGFGFGRGRQQGRRRRRRTRIQEFTSGVGQVTGPVLVFYCWLLWNY